MQGNSFKFYIDNIYRGSITDNSHTSGKIGYGYSAEWNDYINFDRIEWTETGTITVPAYPTNLSASAESHSQIRINWSDKSSNESGWVPENSTREKSLLYLPTPQLIST